jgi:hypothetical protein
VLADDDTSGSELIAARRGLADDQLDARPTDGGGSIRETVDRVLSCDRDSIDTLKASSGSHRHGAAGRALRCASRDAHVNSGANASSRGE